MNRTAQPTRRRAEADKIAGCKRSFGQRITRSWWKLLLLVAGLVAVGIALAVA